MTPHAYPPLNQLASPVEWYSCHAVPSATHISLFLPLFSLSHATDIRSSDHPDTSSDVYSFGVILLELITGRQAAPEDNVAATSSEPLLTWATPLLGEDYSHPDIAQLLDPRVAVEANGKVAMMMAIITKHCLRAYARPSMKVVAEKLRLAEAIQLQSMGRGS